jgi:predicted  nucleic acid-binding Zn-ribbon protein
MERAEAAAGRVSALQAERASVTAHLERTTADRDDALRLLGADHDEASAARAALAGDLPADLVVLYEKIRASSSGTGAARLHQRRCEGCHMELNPTDLQRIATAPPDEVLRCEECRRILVRVPESGL